MAKIIENLQGGRRKILLSGYDVLNIVKTYQTLVGKAGKTSDVLDVLRENYIYLPEDF